MFIHFHMGVDATFGRANRFITRNSIAEMVPMIIQDAHNRSGLWLSMIIPAIYGPIAKEIPHENPKMKL